jgi:hypothetical protein
MPLCAAIYIIRSDIGNGVVGHADPTCSLLYHYSVHKLLRPSEKAAKLGSAHRDNLYKSKDKYIRFLYIEFFSVMLIQDFFVPIYPESTQGI